MHAFRVLRALFSLTSHLGIERSVGSSRYLVPPLGLTVFPSYGYFGTLQTYDANACAAKCNAVSGCISFNLYFERKPTVNPGGGCLNLSSTTTIECVLWGGPVTTGNTVNTGQPREQFVVAIAGSNEYLSNAVASVPGYGPAQPYGNNAINATYDQNGYNIFLGSAIFQGAFNAELCAAACTQKSDYARAHPPTDGTPVQTSQVSSMITCPRHKLMGGLVLQHIYSIRQYTGQRSRTVLCKVFRVSLRASISFNMPATSLHLCYLYRRSALIDFSGNSCGVMGSQLRHEQWTIP